MYRTYEPTRDRLVAVKVFRLDITPEQAQALANELARAAEAGLFHPSIVEPVAAGVEGTVAYRAEEYVAAESLDVAMRHYAPAPIEKALPFVTQIAGAIDFARAAGVGHGALHPRDIFVTPDEARATGFGVVEALERVGLRAPVRRPYSAPERIAGEAWSTAADVFSLAAIAYELLTGRRPSGTGEQIGSLDGGGRRERDDAVYEVLARGMHEVPSKRYASALAFVAALEAAGRGERATESPVDRVAEAPIAAAAVVLPSVPEPLDQPSDAPATEPLRAEPAAAATPAAAIEEPADVRAEREEDEAHYELSRDEVDAEQGEPTRVDEHADASETLAAEPARFTDALAGDRVEEGAELDGAPPIAALDDEIVEAEPELVTDTAAEDPRAFAMADAEIREDPHFQAPTQRTRGRDPGGAAPFPPEAYTRQPVELAGAEDRARPAMLPVAVTLMIGLLIGFAAGYAIGSRGEPVPAPSQTRDTAPAPGAPSGAQPSSPQQGKAYSEQVVAQPPARPPAIPQEVPPVSRGAAAPQRGRIVVQSTPMGAGVTVNGRWRGRTPLTLDDVAFGPYTIRVVQPGYGVAREEFTLSASAPSRSIAVTLPRDGGPPPPRPAPAVATTGTGSLYVDSRPRGAQVFVDGRLVGATPLRLGEVQAGSHRVRLELPDHGIWTTTAQVASGREARVTGSLDRIR